MKLTDGEYSDSQIIRNGLQVCSGGFAHIMGPKCQCDNIYSMEMDLNLWLGEFNGSGFDWDQEDVFVDLLLTEDVPQDDPLIYNGSGWQHRLNVAKNHFENEILLTWTDTRYVETCTINAQPDLYGWSKNYHTGEINPTVCFTEGTLYETFYYFTYGADKAIYHPETMTYTIPYMNGVTPGEFSGNTSATEDPISYDYVAGIEFPALGDFVAINETPNGSGFKVTQNQPNPFTGSTMIEVTSDAVAPFSVEVSNIMGQTVYTFNARTINGTMQIELDASDLESGIYFYTVRMGAESISKKMIVE